MPFLEAANPFSQYLAPLGAKYIVEKRPKNVKNVGKIAFSTRIKDAGIAIRHSRGYIISILQGPEMSFRGWALWLQGPKIMKKCFKS